MRLFIALEISGAARERIAEFARSLHRLVRSGSWTPPDHYHLTLKFLGHVEEGRVAAVRAALAAVAERHTPFELDWIGAGGFPSLSAPRVLWVGAQERSGTLHRLQADAEAEMIPLGFALEERAFAAHLTLGRIKHPAPNPKLEAALEAAKSQCFGFTRVEEIHLLQSQLHPQGAIYTVVDSWPLRG